MELQRAQLGIDGDCSFALLGEDIQGGEAEFVEIIGNPPIGSAAWYRAADVASRKAYRALQARLPEREFSYYIGPSHPNFC